MTPSMSNSTAVGCTGELTTRTEKGVPPIGREAATESLSPKTGRTLPVTETVHVYAGDCTTSYSANDDSRRQRGRVVVVHKPDDTVLVHDAEGYQPVEWLTRANAV